MKTLGIRDKSSLPLLFLFIILLLLTTGWFMNTEKKEHKLPQGDMIKEVLLIKNPDKNFTKKTKIDFIVKKYIKKGINRKNLGLVLERQGFKLHKKNLCETSEWSCFTWFLLSRL